VCTILLAGAISFLQALALGDRRIPATTSRRSCRNDWGKE